MSKLETSKQKSKLFWSISIAVVSLILISLVNFIPVLYFTAVGFPKESNGIENNPIFNVALLLGYASMVTFVVAIILSILLYFRKSK